MRYFWLGSLLILLASTCSKTPIPQAFAPTHARWARDPKTLDSLALPNPSPINANSLVYPALPHTDYQHDAPALAQALRLAYWLGNSLALLNYGLREVAVWDIGRPVLATGINFALKLIQCPRLPNENSRAQFGFIRQVRIDTANPRRFSLLCRSKGKAILTISGDLSVLPEASPSHAQRGFSLAAPQNGPAGRPPVAALVQRYQQANAARHLYVRLVKSTPFGVSFAPILHTGAIGMGNFTQFDNADTDRLPLAISTKGNVARKRQLLHHFQVLRREKMPLVPLLFVPHRLAGSRGLQHVVASGIKPGYAAMVLSWPANSAPAEQS